MYWDSVRAPSFFGDPVTYYLILVDVFLHMFSRLVGIECHQPDMFGYKTVGPYKDPGTLPKGSICMSFALFHKMLTG